MVKNAADKLAVYGIKALEFNNDHGAYKIVMLTGIVRLGFTHDIFTLGYYIRSGVKL